MSFKLHFSFVLNHFYFSSHGHPDMPLTLIGQSGVDRKIVGRKEQCDWDITQVLANKK